MKRTAGVLAGTALLTTLVVGCHSGGGAASAARLQSDGRVEVADATGPWLYEYAVEWVPLLCLVFMRSGTVWGLDGVIARSNPRWRWAFAGMGAASRAAAAQG